MNKTPQSRMEPACKAGSRASGFSRGCLPGGSVLASLHFGGFPFPLPAGAGASASIFPCRGNPRTGRPGSNRSNAAPPAREHTDNQTSFPMKTIALSNLSTLLWIFLIQFCIQIPAFSQSVLNYQGRVISGGTAFNGTGQFKFAIVSSDGETFHWKNDGTTTAVAPATAVSLPVSKGLFSVQLGDESIVSMGTIASSVLLNRGLKLRVWFNDGVKNWQQFIPDQALNLNTSNLPHDPKAILLFQDNGSTGYWDFQGDGEFSHSGFALVPQGTERLICHTKIYLWADNVFYDINGGVADVVNEVELTIDFGGDVLKQVFRRESDFFVEQTQGFRVGKVPQSGIVNYKSSLRMKTKDGLNCRGSVDNDSRVRFGKNPYDHSVLHGYLIITTAN
jgi:hypothetical protein